MKVLEAISKGFGVAGRNFGLLTVLFVFNLIWNLAPMPFLREGQPPTAFKMTAPIAILSILFLFINIFIQGGVFGVLKDVISSDKKAVLGNFAKYGGKFYVRLLGMGLFILAIVILGILIVSLLFGIAAVAKNIIVNIVVVSLAVILIAIALYYLFLLFLGPYILVVDDVGIFKALATSLKFVRSHLLKVLGLSILLMLIGLGIAFIAGIINGILSLLIKGAAFQVLTGVITGAVNAYLTIIISAALMVYYYALSSVGKGDAR